MKLQLKLHVSIEPAAASLQRFNWSGPPPGTRNFSQNSWYMYHVYLQKVPCSGKGTWPVEPLHGSCSRLNADVQLKLQLHFLVQYNGVFTTVKLRLSRVLEKIATQTSRANPVQCHSTHQEKQGWRKVGRSDGFYQRFALELYREIVQKTISSSNIDTTIMCGKGAMM